MGITLAAGAKRLPREIIRWLLALIREHLALFIVLAVLVGIGWLLAGWG